MEIENRQKLLLAESFLDASEQYLLLAKTGDPQTIGPRRLGPEDFVTLQKLCGTVGAVANLATSVISMVREIERIKAEATHTLNQASARVEITLAQVRAISSTLETMQRILLSMPNDYSDRYLMEKKVEILNRMCDLTTKIADLV